MLNMLKENGELSLTRVLPTVGYAAFVIVSMVLAFTGKTWGNYSEFTAATGGAIIIQLGNKWINSKYNTPLGSAGKNGDK